MKQDAECAGNFKQRAHATSATGKQRAGWRVVTCGIMRGGVRLQDLPAAVVEQTS